MDEVLEVIRQQVESNPVVIYMKGTPDMPRCGFSQRASQALAATGFPFAYAAQGATILHLRHQEVSAFLLHLQ